MTTGNHGYVTMHAKGLLLPEVARRPHLVYADGCRLEDRAICHGRRT